MKWEEKLHTHVAVFNGAAVEEKTKKGKEALCACGRFRVCVDVELLVAEIVSEQLQAADMRLRRVFLAAVFCCCISVSKLLQMRSVDDPCKNPKKKFPSLSGLPCAFEIEIYSFIFSSS